MTMVRVTIIFKSCFKYTALRKFRAKMKIENVKNHKTKFVIKRLSLDQNILLGVTSTLEKMSASPKRIL